MEMYNPAHPGEILSEDYLKPLRLTVTEAARRLRVTRKTLSSIVNCRSRITPEMAMRLAKALNTTPNLWLNMQQNYDLSVIERGKSLEKELNMVTPFDYETVDQT